MGCSACKKKRQQSRSGKSSKSVAPNKSKSKPKPSGGAAPKPARSPKSDGWRGGNPFPEKDEVSTIENSDSFWEGHRSEDSDGPRKVTKWINIPEDCEECEKSYENMLSESNAYRHSRVRPLISKLQKEKTKLDLEALELKKKIEALKYYLNDMKLESVDITDITDPIEEHIQNTFNRLFENNQ